MFYEYALDPAVLSTWESVRFFLDSFGPWKGRFLAEYPRKWKRMVFEGLRCRDVEKHAIIERLQRLDHRALSRREGATYDGQRSWRANVEQEHARLPFRAVIVSSDGHDEFIEADQVTDGNPLWKVEPGAVLPRDPVVVIGALELLLRESNAIVIVDPYFHPEKHEKRLALVHLCRAVVGREVRIEVHIKDHLSEAELERAAKALPQHLPWGMSVMLRAWRERVGGERFHNRYILTNIGGVQFGDGIERGASGQSDRISLLGTEDLARLWAFFIGSALAYEAACEPIFVTGTKREP